MERIIYAQDELINQGLRLFQDKKEEVILTYGNQESQTIEDLLKKAHSMGRKFRVIIVDSAPDYFGREMAKRLAHHGIKVQYTLISMANFLMHSVTKVFLSASYVLCNGALVAPMGTSMIGCLGHRSQLPVVVVCETYKFEDRVNLDQDNNFEHSAIQKFENNYLRKMSDNAGCLQDIKKQSTSDVFVALEFDLTQQKYLSMIVCDIGNIPPHSVPVVIREIMNEQEDAIGVLDSESETSSILSEEGSSQIFDDIEERGSQEDEIQTTALQQKNQRMKMMQMRNMEMEEVPELSLIHI